MSDFWKHSILEKQANRVVMQVWAIYEDCQYFQYSKDWAARALYCANEDIAQLIVDEENKITLAEYPETPTEYLTGELDLGDWLSLELVDKVVSKISILSMENVPALPDFWTQIYHSDAHLQLLPTAVYEVIFVDKKFADALAVGETWESPCFDIRDSNDLGMDMSVLSFGENPNY